MNNITWSGLAGFELPSTTECFILAALWGSLLTYYYWKEGLSWWTVTAAAAFGINIGRIIGHRG